MIIAAELKVKKKEQPEPEEENLKNEKPVWELKVLGSQQAVGNEIGEKGDFLIRVNGEEPRFLNPADLIKYRDKNERFIKISHVAVDTWVVIKPINSILMDIR